MASRPLELGVEDTASCLRPPFSAAAAREVLSPSARVILSVVLTTRSSYFTAACLLRIGLTTSEVYAFVAAQHVWFVHAGFRLESDLPDNFLPLVFFAKCQASAAMGAAAMEASSWPMSAAAQMAGTKTRKLTSLVVSATPSDSIAYWTQELTSLLKATSFPTVSEATVVRKVATRLGGFGVKAVESALTAVADMDKKRRNRGLSAVLVAHLLSKSPSFAATPADVPARSPAVEAAVARILSSGPSVVLHVAALSGGTSVDDLTRDGKAEQAALRTGVAKARLGAALRRAVVVGLSRCGFGELLTMVKSSRHEGLYKLVMKGIHVGTVLKKLLKQADKQADKEGAAARTGLERVAVIVAMLHGARCPDPEEDRGAALEFERNIRSPLARLTRNRAFDLPDEELLHVKSKAKKSEVEVDDTPAFRHAVANAWRRVSEGPEDLASVKILAGQRVPRLWRFTVEDLLSRCGNNGKTWTRLLEMRLVTGKQVVKNMRSLVLLNIPAASISGVLGPLLEKDLQSILLLEQLLRSEFSQAKIDALVEEVKGAAVGGGGGGGGEEETGEVVLISEKVVQDKKGKSTKIVMKKSVSTHFPGELQSYLAMLSGFKSTALDAMPTTALAAAFEKKFGHPVADEGAAAKLLVDVRRSTHALVCLTPELRRNQPRRGVPPSAPSTDEFGSVPTLGAGETLCLDRMQPEGDADVRELEGWSEEKHGSVVAKLVEMGYSEHRAERCVHALGFTTPTKQGNPFTSRYPQKTINACVAWLQDGKRAADPVLDTPLRVRLGQKLLAGIWWCETAKSGRVDLDLSFCFFDSEWHMLDHCSYQKLLLAGGGAAHSGDVTSAPPPLGSRETVMLDMAKLREQYPTTKHVAIMCFSYTQQAMDNYEASVFIADPMRKAPNRLGMSILTATRLKGSGTANLAGYLTLDVPAYAHGVILPEEEQRAAAAAAGAQRVENPLEARMTRQGELDLAWQDRVATGQRLRTIFTNKDCPLQCGRSATSAQAAIKEAMLRELEAAALAPRPTCEVIAVTAAASLADTVTFATMPLVTLRRDTGGGETTSAWVARVLAVAEKTPSTTTPNYRAAAAAVPRGGGTGDGDGRLVVFAGGLDNPVECAQSNSRHAIMEGGSEGEGEGQAPRLVFVNVRADVERGPDTRSVGRSGQLAVIGGTSYAPLAEALLPRSAEEAGMDTSA